MNTYRITDLYIAAYLKALGYNCTTEIQGKRCFFLFTEEAKVAVSAYISNSDRENFNVNAVTIVNEVKQLKAFVNNL